MNRIPHRLRTKPVKVGRLTIGGGHPIVVQSMVKRKTHDVEGVCREVEALKRAGCELVRVAVPDEKAARALKEIRSRTDIPLVADLHFRRDLALQAIEAGVDKIRLNPGTMRKEAIREILALAKERGVAVRIGVNSGSLPKDIAEKFPPHSPQALVAAAERGLEVCQEVGLDAVVVSLKSSSVTATIEAYREFARRYDLPLHLGITEAGPPLISAVRSGAGLGILLHEGIGDTIRVSATGNSVTEVRIAYELLSALGLRRERPILISCPTCGRLELDLEEFEKIVKEVEEMLNDLAVPLTVAVMGCVVNGPGEAREADIGIACGKGGGVLFRKGEKVRKVSASELVYALRREIEEMVGEGQRGESRVPSPESPNWQPETRRG